MKLTPMFENERVAVWKPPFREDFDEYKKQNGIESGYETHGVMVRNLSRKCIDDTKPNYVLCSWEVHKKYMGAKGWFTVRNNWIRLVCVVYGAEVPKFGDGINETKFMDWIMKKYDTTN